MGLVPQKEGGGECGVCRIVSRTDYLAEWSHDGDPCANRKAWKLTATDRDVQVSSGQPTVNMKGSVRDINTIMLMSLLIGQCINLMWQYRRKRRLTASFFFKAYH